MPSVLYRLSFLLSLGLPARVIYCYSSCVQLPDLTPPYIKRCFFCHIAISVSEPHKPNAESSMYKKDEQPFDCPSSFRYD